MKSASIVIGRILLIIAVLLFVALLVIYFINPQLAGTIMAFPFFIVGVFLPFYLAKKTNDNRQEYGLGYIPGMIIDIPISLFGAALTAFLCGHLMLSVALRIAESLDGNLTWFVATICPCEFDKLVGDILVSAWGVIGYTRFGPPALECRGGAGIFEPGFIQVIIPVVLALTLYYLVILWSYKITHKIVHKYNQTWLQWSVTILLSGFIFYLISLDPFVTPVLGEKLNKTFYPEQTESVDYSTSFLLYQAVARKDIDSVKHILETEVNMYEPITGQGTILMDEYGVVDQGTPMDVASRINNQEIIELFGEKMAMESPEKSELWKRGLLLSKKDFIETICNNDLETLELFIAAGMDIQPRGDFHPLNEAIKSFDINTIGFLIDHGIDVNAADRLGNTPLMIAARERMYDNVKYLVEKGADINVTNVTGVNALWFTVRNRNFEIAQFLVLQGADPNVQDKRDGLTPLMMAVSSDHVETVKLLLENGADVNIKSREGKLATYYNFKHNREIYDLINAAKEKQE